MLIKEKNDVVERSNNKFLQRERDFVKVCPKCKSTHIFIRRRKIPKYRCHDCGNGFDNPKDKIASITSKQKNDFGKQYSNPDDE